MDKKQHREIKNRLSVLAAEKGLADNRRYTQRLLASETGVNRQTIGNYMRQTIDKYDKRIVSIFCTYFGIEPSEFFTWEETNCEGDGGSADVNVPLPATA